MKRFLLTVLLGVVPKLHAMAFEAHLQFMVDDKLVSLPRNAEASFVANVLTLFKTTGATSDATVPTAEHWNQAARGTYILMSFEYPQEITVRHRDRIEVTELVIPLTDPEDPDHLFARRGDRYWAFTKFNPRDSAELLCRPELGLKRYDDFCKVLRGKPE